MVLVPAGIDQELLRHAAADHASSADAEFLRDHDLGAMGRRDPGGAHAARSRTDHEKIDIVTGHSILSKRLPGRATGQRASSLNPNEKRYGSQRGETVF